FAERLLEAGADRDRAALAEGDRSLAKRDLERPSRGLRHRVVDGRHARSAAAEVADGRPDARPGDLLDARPEPLEDHLGILVRDEPTADLRVGMGRDDRLAPLPHEPG